MDRSPRHRGRNAASCGACRRFEDPRTAYNAQAAPLWPFEMTVGCEDPEDCDVKRW